MLSLLLMLFVGQGMHAQHNTVSISGNITNAEGKRLGGVSVYVKVGKETFGNVSDRKGRYDVTFTAADTVTVAFSHVSYAPYSFTASGREDIKKDITLSEKSIALKGVEVEAKSIILGDHVSYIPTKKQVNGANSGVGLLFNMMIPQIDVNPVTGDVQADFQILSTYNHKFGQKLDLGIQMGFDLSTYKVNDNDNVTMIWLRPVISGNYMINNSNYLSFYGAMGSVTPQMSMLNGATQYISEYEMMRGNPDLKTGTVLYGNISYSKYWNNVSLSAYVNYNGCLDIGNNWYTIEENKLISTFRNCGDWHSYNIGVNSVFQLFNKSLQLRLTAALENTNLPGYYDDKSHRPVFGANLFYSIGEFSFSGFYNTPKTSLNSDPMYTKEKCNYGLTATWNHRGLFVQLGCQRIFDVNGYNRSYYDYGCYKFDRRTVNNSIGQIAYISLSYSFDFGRQVKRERVNINTSGQSGILRP